MKATKYSTDELVNIVVKDNNQIAVPYATITLTETAKTSSSMRRQMASTVKATADSKGVVKVPKSVGTYSV